MSATGVTIERIVAGYGDEEVLREVSLVVEPGELVALLGPSGCGKTTLLRIVAGLHDADSGDVLFDGRSVTDLPAERRGAVMVFQRPLLFPHLTVAGNVGFGLRMRRFPPTLIERKVEEALALVRLEGFGPRLPHELSGGQEQRVSLARALVTEPRVLLLDEPFSALDESLRAGMRLLVRDLQRRLRITTLFVTHDQREAASFADRLAVLLDGRIARLAPPSALHQEPLSPELARFLRRNDDEPPAFSAEAVSTQGAERSSASRPPDGDPA